MGAQVQNWIKGYLEYCQDLESPDSFLTWVAISTIAAAAQRKVRLQWGEYIYPNLYVVLTAPPGKARKGTAIKPAKRLLRSLGISLVPDSITRAQLVRKFASATTSVSAKDGSGVDIVHSSLTLISLELTVFLGKKDPQLLADVMDWYDCADDWAYENKADATQGVFDHIYGIYFNMLAATTPKLLQRELAKDVTGTGLASRMVFVCENAARFKSALQLFMVSAAGKALEKALLSDLIDISNLVGDFSVTKEYLELYVNWYQNMGECQFDPQRFSDYWARRQDVLRKVTMIHSLARGTDLLLTAEDFHFADNLLKRTEEKMPMAFGGLGRILDAEIMPALIEFISAKKETTDAELLREFLRDVTFTDLQRILSALERTGYIRTMQLGSVRRVWISPKGASHGKVS